ncbi:hypothetical protein EG68_10839 [Paragonimus skrjabini miyazakii]|uniref:Signal recognition particle subunit SRP72 n=1 Tax=Paragonimus skrjabini miyazakii TaxID=59628 RepID=A0A8S9YEW6_9TREM|nr:hypothetical protein EG68_10839 [Paragonimus skrjabini miyazakii]
MYEAKFNIACHFVGKGDSMMAEKLLKEAEKVCREALSEDPEVTEDEVDAELAPIRTQQAYLLQLAKKEEAANHIYQSVMRNRSADPALLAVAANNTVCINKEQNIFDSRKRIKMASIDGLQHKLFVKQRENMLINQGLFYWHTNQADACHVKAKNVLQSNPCSSRALLLLVSQLLKEKQYDRAMAALQSYCTTDDSESGEADMRSRDLGVLLALAQLNLRYGVTNQLNSSLKPERALAVARLFSQLLPDSQLHRPGVMSTRIALHMVASAGDDAAESRSDALAAVSDIIQTALDWYESTNEQDSRYIQLLDCCANFLLQQGQAEFAASLCERQLTRFDMSPTEDQLLNRQALVARLVRAYAQFDRPKAEAACKTLKFKEVISDADVDSMETAFLYGVKAVKRQGRTTDQPPSAESKVDAKSHRKLESTPGLAPDGAESELKVTHSRRKKKRPIRLPKNYQPGVMPDPDRWLPRRERANYRGKRRDKRHQPARGPQGQISGGAEWDASARSPKTNVPSSPQSTDATGSTPKQVSAAVRQQQHRKGRRKGR